MAALASASQVNRTRRSNGSTRTTKSGGQDTLPTYMLGQMKRQLTPEINAISTGLLGLTLLLLTAFFFMTRKNQQ